MIDATEVVREALSAWAADDAVGYRAAMLPVAEGLTAQDWALLVTAFAEHLTYAIALLADRADVDRTVAAEALCTALGGIRRRREGEG